MSEAENDPHAAMDAVYNFAAEQMRNGVKPAVVEQNLVKEGLDAEIAAVVVANLVEARADAIRAAGKQNMVYGALWFIGGSVVTIATYSAAANGGQYVVAWGAILFGGIQFLQGLSQSMTTK